MLSFIPLPITVQISELESTLQLERNRSTENEQKHKDAIADLENKLSAETKQKTDMEIQLVNTKNHMDEFKVS